MVHLDSTNYNIVRMMIFFDGRVVPAKGNKKTSEKKAHLIAGPQRVTVSSQNNECLQTSLFMEFKSYEAGKK